MSAIWFWISKWIAELFALLVVYILLIGLIVIGQRRKK
jgi:hypothetical protein